MGNTHLDCCDMWRLCHIDFKQLWCRTARVENWSQKLACLIRKGQRVSPFPFSFDHWMFLLVLSRIYSFCNQTGGGSYLNSSTQQLLQFWNAQKKKKIWNGLYLSLILHIRKWQTNRVQHAWEEKSIMLNSGVRVWVFILAQLFTS